MGGISGVASVIVFECLLAMSLALADGLEFILSLGLPGYPKKRQCYVLSPFCRQR